MQLFEQGSDGNVTWTNTVLTVGTTPVVTQAMNNARHIVISNISANAIYFTLDGSTPSSASFTLNAGQAISMDGLPATANLKLLASGASSSVAVIGW